MALEPIRKAGGKVVYAWTVEGSVDPGCLDSNNFETEWSPGVIPSGSHRLIRRDEMKSGRAACRAAGILGIAILLTPPLFGASPAPACDRELRIGGTLPLPCTMPLADYEEVLYTWVNDREYTRLGWQKDKHVRDTGPFVLGSNYGTHPAVRIYYSPEVYAWLSQEESRRGELPIGSMIVKEMFAPPAARLEDQRSEYATLEEWEEMVQASVSSWTIMIKDGQTFDGWFWASPTLVSKVGKSAEEYADAIAATVDSNAYPFQVRYSQHGAASCMRCHTTSDGESTFADLANIEGHGLRFRVDQSWRTGLDSAELTDVGGQLVYLHSRLDDLPPEQRPAAGEDEATLFLNAYHGNSSAATVTESGEELASQPLASPAPEFTEYFQLGGDPSGGTSVDPSSFPSFPSQWADHVPAGPHGAEQFITSDNCLGCHGGLGGAPGGVTMFLQTGPDYGDGYNISPFGEWRWSPMGLAGRDPIFYSQLASEMALLDLDFADDPAAFGDDPGKLAEVKSAVVETCLSCHGAMGQRQLLIDHADGTTDLDPTFRREYVYTHTALTREQEEQPNYPYHKYGNLAREGISCTVCHHVDPPTQWRPGMGEDEKLDLFLMHSTTGQFPYSPPDELNGPFDDVIEKPMQHALAITPKYNPYVRESEMCGTCHTINLPNVDCPRGGDPGDPARCKPYPELDRSAEMQAQALEDEYGVDYAKLLADNFPHSIEQATYLEWKNSAFAEPGADYQSCQDCHMPRRFESLDGSIEIEQLSSQIASIQDSTYPEAENSLPDDELYVPVRSDYRRHELVGLNVFLLEMFDQFDPILGVDETDYMTSATTGDRLAVENMLVQGRERTVTVDVEVVEAEGRELVADVTVESLVGHRFPSGVGFRRAWIELAVLDAARGGEIVWASGRTNSVGLIVDAEGNPLPTEFFEDQKWQPHYHGIPVPDCQLSCTDSSGAPGCLVSGACEVVPPPITREDQVQIYEEVTLDGDDRVTFSFIHRDEHPKDNRFLPRGWQPAADFPGEIQQQFMAATEPEGVGTDPDYTEGETGRDRLRYAITLPEGIDAADVTVRATVYSQSIQPYWLKRKFELSGDDPATRRLYYLASHLNTAGTVIDDWKLALVTCTKSATGDVSSGCGAPN